MNSFLTVCAVLCCVALMGCGAKQEPQSQAVSESAPALSAEQRSQERTRILQSIQTMSPEQRAAYFKVHPQDVATLAR